MKRTLTRSVVAALLCLCMVLSPENVFLSMAAADSAPQLTIHRLAESANGRSLRLQNAADDSTQDTYQTPFGARRTAESLPRSYDSRKKKLVTSVKNQSPSGMCWAFSVSSVLETDAIRQGLADVKTVDYSESHLAWFSSNSKTTDKSDPTYGDGVKASLFQVYEGGGNDYMAITALARGSSMAYEEDFQFPNDFLNRKTYQEKDRYTSVMSISAGEMLDCFENESAAVLRRDVKQAIMEHGSVSVSYYSTDFDVHYNTTTIDGKTSTAYYQTGVRNPLNANHTVTIVGWDDDYTVGHFYKGDRPSQKGAWLVKNSWGTEVLTDGYFYLSYEEPTLVDFTAYSAMPSSAFDTIYQYDGIGPAGAISFKKAEQGACANVFTAQRNCYLSRVGFYTLTGKAPVTVQVYVNLKKANDPESGTRVFSKSQTFRYSGYHTVQLPSLQKLKKGTKFAVVLKAVSGKAFDVPVEMNFPFERYYSSQAGQSFIAFTQDGKRAWYEASEIKNRNFLIGQVYSICNVTIKALTVNNAEHTHTWGKAKTIKPTCTTEGYTVQYCTSCNEKKILSTTPATGHKDANNDGKCDACGAAMNNAATCPYCGKVHAETGVEQVIYFIHLLRYYEIL